VDNQTHVLILCFNRLLRESVARILNKRPHFHVTAPHAPADDSCRELMEASAGVVVLDSLQLLGDAKIFTPDRRESRLVKCVLVAMQDDQKLFLTAIRLGALGYVLQEASAAEVVTAIRAVAQGEAVCPSRYARLLFDYFASQTAAFPNSCTRSQLGLTRREQQLVPLIKRGMTNKEIAHELNLSEQTVKNHIHRILRKMGVEDRLSVIEAYQTHSLGL
jgi:two-component system, NarL family, response regulator DevR